MATPTRQPQKKGQTTGERTVISARTDLELKETFEREAPLRGHSASQAFELALKLGLARYLKKYPIKFERVETAA